MSPTGENLFSHFTTVPFGQLDELFRYLIFQNKAVKDNSLAISSLLVVEKPEAGPVLRLQLQ
jgi:hypothetical protein